MEDEPYFVSTDPSLLDLDKVVRLLSDTYWAGGRTREVIKKSMDNSVCFGVYFKADRTQVGFARVVTDHATFSWVCDVIIDPSHRSRGLGKLLMKAVVSHPSVKNTRSLLGTKDAHTLYEHYGYVRKEMMKRDADANPA